MSTYNPFKLYRAYRGMSSRLSEKKVEGNLKGEGIVQGGVVVFDGKGVSRCVYKEMTGYGLPVEEIGRVMDGIDGE